MTTEELDELERKIAELNAQLTEVTRERDTLQSRLDVALGTLTDAKGCAEQLWELHLDAADLHDDGCPADDTCECELVHVVNGLFASLVVKP